MTPTEADWVDRLAAAKAEVERLRAELNDEIRKTIYTKLILNQREADLAAARDAIRLGQSWAIWHEVSDQDVDDLIAQAKKKRKELSEGPDEVERLRADLAAARDAIRLCQVNGEFQQRGVWHEVSNRDVDGWIAAAKELRKALEVKHV